MTFRSAARRTGPRWLAVLALLLITTMMATSAVAVPSFTFVPDDAGANDEPGQKDLTAQASALDGSTFYTAWKWDDTAWNGKNTGDACSLFDTDSPGNGLVDYAVCATVGGNPAEIQQTRVYACSDRRSDRCTNPVLIGTNIGDSWCETSQVAGQFGGTDTQATCNITLAEAGTNPPASDLDNGTLLNTCSYPSQEPNSDPSDCVLTITNVNTSISTLSSGTTTWTATLNDTATMSPLTATGSVVFKLWQDSSCTVLQWETGAVALVSGIASSNGASTVSGTNVITNATVDGDGVYYWTVDYTPSGAFNGSSSTCGEATTITPASVAGSSG